MFYRLKTRFRKARFERLTRGILDTPPMEVKDAPWSIISMVGNNDAQMYLLSMKSFYQRMGKGKLVAIVDRDHPAALIDTLSGHFPGIRFVILEDIDTGRCQRGGTWERLVHLLDHAEKEYAIQVDCDTLAFGADVDEVRRCAEQNLAFTLGNRGRPIETMASIAADAKAMDSNYIGIVSEREFDKYPNADTTRYVRASSGFAGFSKGGFPRAEIERFHEIMEGILKDRWREWGTEQCGSNFAVANSPGAVVLPFPKYGNFWPGLVRGQSAFLHFFGTHRYDDDYFADQGRAEIARLSA
jgi:hypothetical protein